MYDQHEVQFRTKYRFTISTAQLFQPSEPCLSKHVSTTKYFTQIYVRENTCGVFSLASPDYAYLSK